MFIDNPLGVGAGNWRVNIPFYSRYMSDTTRAVAFKTIYFQRPHNDWVWVLAELGIIGFVLYVSLFGMSLYYAIKTKKVLLYSCLIASMVVACFSFPKERTFHTLYQLLIMALCVAAYHKSTPITVKPKAVYIGSVLVLAGLSFTLIVFGIRYRTEQNVFKALHAKKAQNWESVLDYTHNISRFSTLDSYGTPLVYYQGIAYFLKKDFGRALKNFQKAIKENPNHIYVMMNLAACLNIHKRTDEARAYYEKITELYPGYKVAENNLAALNAVAMKGKEK
jgi:tetratricopeptide (TPR) repeat protein